MARQGQASQLPTGSCHTECPPRTLVAPHLYTIIRDHTEDTPPTSSPPSTTYMVKPHPVQTNSILIICTDIVRCMMDLQP
ncbi:hypothetical protein BaRGS_00018944, partial [Batillaria attramentaria]